MVMEEEQTCMELASESVPVPQVINSNELRNNDINNQIGTPKKKPRLRKKAMHAAIRKQMEFYFGDANLRKDRFLGNLIKMAPHIELEVFLKFNKIRALTTDINQIVKALQTSEILSVSEDGLRVCRVTPISHKENIEECTVYVQRIPLNADHEWLSNVFSQYGTVSYVSIPKYKINKKIKGFAFVEFEEPSSVAKCLKAFREKNCVLPSQTAPESLLSIITFHEEEMMEKEGQIQASEEPEVVDSGRNDTKENSETNDMMETETENVEAKSSNKRKHPESELSESNEHDSETDSSQNTENTSKKSKQRDAEDEVDQSQATGECETIEKVRAMNKDDNEALESEPNDEEDEFKNKSKKRKISEISKKEASEISDENSSEQNESAVDSEKDMKCKKKKNKSTSDAKDKEIPELDENEKEGTVENNQPEEVLNDEVFCEGEVKKKRKRKRNNRAEKVDTADIGMQIMAKKDWKVLRNKYLELQRSKMKSLKAHLKRAQWNHWNNYEKYKESDKAKAAKDDCKENTEESKTENSTQRFVFTPGVIVKVEMDEPCNDPKNFKAELKRNSSIKYVDIVEGASEAFVRCETSEAAKMLVSQSNDERSMSIVQGEEESAYWIKMSKDREEKLGKKVRVKQRGRDKLLKKAEKELGKHIKFDEV